MGERREAYRMAATEHTTEEERLAQWTVFGYYGIEERVKDAVAIAPRNVPKENVRSVGKVDGRSVHKAEVAYASAGDLRYVRRRVTYSLEKEKAERFVNLGHMYMPLTEYPDLFDKFARLADGGEITREVWRAWINQYGVLGIPSGGSRKRQRNQETDRFSTFVQEAQLANRTLTLFEALNSKDGPDQKTVRELLPKKHGGEAGELEETVRWTIADTVQQKIDGDCYQRIVPRTSTWREKELGPFAREWAFRSLLGAMWLQFMWLATANGPRYCENCGRLIPDERNEGAKTCSGRCKKARQRRAG